MDESRGGPLTRRQETLIAALEGGAATLARARGNTRAPLDAIDPDLVTEIGNLCALLKPFSQRAITGCASRAEWLAIASTAERFAALVRGGVPPEDLIIDGEPQNL